MGVAGTVGISTGSGEGAGQGGGLTGAIREHRGGELAEGPGARRELDDGNVPVDSGTTQAEEQDRQFFSQIAGQHHHARRRARLVDGGPGKAEHDLGGQSVAELGVDRVGADHGLGELGPRVGVLVGEPGPAEHPDGLGAVLGAHAAPGARPPR